MRGKDARKGNEDAQIRIEKHPGCVLDIEDVSSANLLAQYSPGVPVPKQNKVGFIFAHSQHSHISAFNKFLITCAIKLFLANSNQRHHCQPTTYFFTIYQNGQVLF